jgi:hypothetical protein
MKAGRRTEGQMKSGASLLDSSLNITITDDGFYTIYVVAQSRRTYLTYVYVQR